MNRQEPYMDGKMVNQEVHERLVGAPPPDTPPLPATPTTDTLPEGFKMTELGPLPEEWKVVRLGEVISAIRNGITKRQNKTGLGLPVTRIETIADGKIDPLRVGYINDISEADVERYKLKQGDILFSHINSEEQIGKSAIYFGKPDLLLHGMNLLLIRVSDSIDFYYLHYLFQRYRECGMFVAMAARAVGQASINQGKMKSLLIPLPPLPEQRAIAHVLRSVQGAKEATERVIKALKELKKSLMRHLFTYGPAPLDKIEQVALQETEIGSLPAPWQVVRLGEVVEKTQQFDPRRRADWRFKYVDVSSISNKRLKIESYVEYMGKDAPHRARKIVKANDVIFATVRPYLKRIAIVPENLDGQIVSTAFCVLRGKFHIVDPLFIFYAVSTDDFVERVSANQHGSSYPAVTDKDILHQYISLPPLSEQQEIARILQTVDEKIAAEEKRRSALETLFKSLLAQLMSGRLRLPKQLVAQFEQEVS